MSYFENPVKCSHQRTYAEAPNWLLCLSIRMCHEVEGGLSAAYPTARAVIDDFGNLVIVRKWS